MDNYFKFLSNLIRKKNSVKEPTGEMRKAVLDKTFPTPPPPRSVKGKVGEKKSVFEVTEKNKYRGWFEDETGGKAVVKTTDGVHNVLIDVPSFAYVGWLEEMLDKASVFKKDYEKYLKSDTYNKWVDNIINEGNSKKEFRELPPSPSVSYFKTLMCKSGNAIVDTWFAWNPSIYELVDVTNEACYYSLGFWHSLEELVRELNKCKTPYDLKSYGKEDYDDYVKVEVLYREGGWEGGRKSVYVREWHKTFSKINDSEEWHYKAEPIPTTYEWVKK